MKITQRDRDVLNELRGCHDAKCGPMEWARPLDVGGSNGSHHSPTLAKLTRYGLVEARQRWGCFRLARGSKVYRITDAGREALKAAR